MKSTIGVLKQYKEDMRQVDPAFCTKIINIIGKDEFNETCRAYLGEFDADFKAYNFILGAYENKGYHLYDTFPQLLDIYKEFDNWENQECEYYAEMLGLESEEFRNSFLEYMKPHIINL